MLMEVIGRQKSTCTRYYFRIYDWNLTNGFLLINTVYAPHNHEKQTYHEIRFHVSQCPWLEASLALSQ